MTSDKAIPLDASDTSITLVQAEAFLSERFGIAPGTIETLQPGAWSTVFAYIDRGQQRIIRFSHYLDDLEHDQRAAGWSTPAMPVPRVLELGEAFDRHYVISERVPGGFIDHLDGPGFRALLPALFAMLDDMRDTDISNMTGFGGWDTTGNGTCFRSASTTPRVVAMAGGPPWRTRPSATPGSKSPSTAFTGWPSTSPTSVI
jgi:hypothetical protein